MKISSWVGVARVRVRLHGFVLTTAREGRFDRWLTAGARMKFKAAFFAAGSAVFRTSADSVSKACKCLRRNTCASSRSPAASKLSDISKNNPAAC